MTWLPSGKGLLGGGGGGSFSGFMRVLPGFLKGSGFRFWGLQCRVLRFGGRGGGGVDDFIGF